MTIGHRRTIFPIETTWNILCASKPMVAGWPWASLAFWKAALGFTISLINSSTWVYVLILRWWRKKKRRFWILKFVFNSKWIMFDLVKIQIKVANLDYVWHHWSTCIVSSCKVQRNIWEVLSRFHDASNNVPWAQLFSMNVSAYQRIMLDEKCHNDQHMKKGKMSWPMSVSGDRQWKLWRGVPS